MTMFSKLKHIQHLRSQAKTLQQTLSAESVTVEKRGVTITLDGNQKVTAIKLAEGLSSTDLEKTLPDVFNEANEKIKRIMAQKIQSMGGLAGLTE